jgi:hypothetical protein
MRIYNRLICNRLFSKLIAILLLFSSCQTSQESTKNDAISSAEREWMTQFFRDIMLFNHGIYTLWGTHKPLIMIPVRKYSEEEMKSIEAFYNPEEKKEEGLWVELVEGYTLADAWDKWESIRHRYPMKKFMLFKLEDEDPHVFFIVFLDIIKTSVVIQENYEAFQKVLGVDFNPLELTLQMNQKDSIFWKNLNSYLHGLLFGFGKVNSQLFHWKHFDHPQTCDNFLDNMGAFASNSQLKGEIKYTIDDFQLPSFMVFNDIEPMVKIYTKERKTINNIYKNKDFLDLTLQKLSE